MQCHLKLFLIREEKEKYIYKTPTPATEREARGCTIRNGRTAGPKRAKTYPSNPSGANLEPLTPSSLHYLPVFLAPLWALRQNPPRALLPN